MTGMTDVTKLWDIVSISKRLTPMWQPEEKDTLGELLAGNNITFEDIWEQPYFRHNTFRGHKMFMLPNHNKPTHYSSLFFS